VKAYEGPEQEVEQAVQMCLPEVVSEDPRFMERDAPPLAEDFPEGTKVFFLGEHAYGGAAQISSTSDKTLSVILAVSLMKYFVFLELLVSNFDNSSIHRKKRKFKSSKPLWNTA
jgi:hypothetical protein